MDGTWKLKEVLPPAGGEKLITEENVDEDSSAGQMQWLLPGDPCRLRFSIIT
jgi:hypothetical protein